jgi:hypothetical protein
MAERNGSADHSQQWAQPILSPKQYHVSSVQSRHNSCPSLHQLTTTPPPLRPTYSSPIANKGNSPVSNECYGAHTQWPAHPAAPILNSPEPRILISPMSAQGHVIPGFQHENAQQQHMVYQYRFPTQSTAASVSSVAAMNVEQMTVNEWKRWVGSGGSG